MPPLGGIFIGVKYGRSINFILDSVGGYMGSITSFSKQVVKVLICFCLVYTPFFANAASLGGWSLGSPVASGASAIVNGTKEIILNGASKIAKGTAKITPNASQVANVLKRGAAGYALSVAVEQLLGAVDWVLDPANNQIVYSKPSDPEKDRCVNPKDCAHSSFLYASAQAPTSGQFYSTPESACRAWASAYSTSTRSVVFKSYDAETKSCSHTVTINGKSSHLGSTIVVKVNTDYDSAAEAPPKDEKKTLPLDVVAAQVISNAAGGDVSAQQAITAAAQDVINEAENDSAKAAPIIQQLEASKAIEAENTATGEQTQNPEKPNVTDISLEFPAFCGWAPTVCEAAQTVISFPITLTQWWNTANQKADSWAQSISQAWAEFNDTPPKNEDTELEIEQPEIEVDTDINFGGACPAPLSTSFSMFGSTHTMEFSFDPVCEIASFIKPVVVSISAFSAALIIGSIRTEDD